MKEVEGGKSVPLHPARSPPPTAPGLAMDTANESFANEGNGSSVHGSNGAGAQGFKGSSVDGCKRTAVNGNKGSSSNTDAGTRVQSQSSSDLPHPASAIIVDSALPTAAVASDTAKQAKRAVKFESGGSEQPSAKRQKVLSAESQAAMAAIAATARLPTQVRHPLEA